MEFIHHLLTSILILNIIGFLGSLFFAEYKEKQIKYYCFSIVGIIFLHLLILVFLHLVKHFPSYNIYLLRLFHHGHYSFDINFLWNTTTLIFLLTGNIITLLILYFSGYYMHREIGYKRFFNTLMFFYFAFNIVVASGNFTTLFIGWEYLGISSFLLIAFYRDRYLPVRNAVKVFSVYRIGDIGLIISVWALHQLVHEQVLFYDLKEHSFVLAYFDKNYWITLFIGLGILIAAIGKSALFPFSYWLPRAMEGPTGSSAIFYGALSVHAGILLLLKTYYLWSEIYVLRVVMIFVGLITYFTANKSAKLQSSIKPQIAYSSIVQIGIMFIELAMGLKWLVHIHFVSNAFLRTYQLLVSPSIAAYIMKQQVYYSSFMKIKKHFIHYLPERYYYTLYTLAQHEWYLDNLINNYIFSNIKKSGKSLKFINEKSFVYVILPFFILAFYIHEYRLHLLHFPEKIFASILAIIAVLLIFRAFSERFKPFLVLYLIFFSELFIALSVSYNERYDVLSFLIYLSGIFPGFIGAWICLLLLRNQEPNYFDLNKYYGHVYEHRWLGFVFLVCILSLIGFPVSLTFMGEDIIINHIHPQQIILAAAFAIHFIFTGITGIKLYARLFLGPHCKNYHEKSIKAG